MVKEIHLAEVFFTDQISSKIRPILIIKQNSFGDYIYLPLTTNLEINGFKIKPEWMINGNLPKTSNVIYEKIGVIHRNSIRKFIASISDQNYKEIIGKLIEFLNK